MQLKNIVRNSETKVKGLERKKRHTKLVLWKNRKKLSIELSLKN